MTKKVEATPMRVLRPSMTNAQAATEAARLMGSPNKDRSARIVAKVTPAERRKLKALALELEIDLQELILRALAAQHPELELKP